MEIKKLTPSKFDDSHLGGTQMGVALGPLAQSSSRRLSSALCAQTRFTGKWKHGPKPGVSSEVLAPACNLPCETLPLSLAMWLLRSISGEEAPVSHARVICYVHGLAVICLLWARFGLVCGAICAEPSKPVWALRQLWFACKLLSGNQYP